MGLAISTVHVWVDKRESVCVCVTNRQLEARHTDTHRHTRTRTQSDTHTHTHTHTDIPQANKHTQTLARLGRRRRIRDEEIFDGSRIWIVVAREEAVRALLKEKAGEACMRRCSQAKLLAHLSQLGLHTLHSPVAHELQAWAGLLSDRKHRLGHRLDVVRRSEVEARRPAARIRRRVVHAVPRGREIQVGPVVRQRLIARSSQAGSKAAENAATVAATVVAVVAVGVVFAVCVGGMRRWCFVMFPSSCFSVKGRQRW